MNYELNIEKKRHEAAIQKNKNNTKKLNEKNNKKHDKDDTNIDEDMEDKNKVETDEERVRKIRSKKVDYFPGDKPIPAKLRRKYKRGHKLKAEGIRSEFRKYKIESREIQLSAATKTAARTELLLNEQPGFLEPEHVDEFTSDLTQHDIMECVDVGSANKSFNLDLDHFGPYRINYTRNGRQLLLGGKRGHLAAFDWQTKRLMFEINVMQTVNDVKWLHNETMCAVAQKQWTYIYDNQGIELHCLKMLDRVMRMEFLPYHFLLATASEKGYMSFIDVSVGSKVAGFSTGLGRLDVMCQNPRNAIVHLGHIGGTVTMWSPNVKEPLVKMLCHGTGIRSVTVDSSGNYMATAGSDKLIKIWDLRTFKELSKYKVTAGANYMSFSQNGILAASSTDCVETYQDILKKTVDRVYLKHSVGNNSFIANTQFCPFEDVLGIGHSKGFSSILIPGAGEANFDALESNPYATKNQRRQAEVKMLLEKIQPELITMDTTALGKMNQQSVQDEMEARKNLLYLKTKKIEVDPRHRMKGASKAGRFEKRKKGVRHENVREQVKQNIKDKRNAGIVNEDETGKPKKEYSALDRFKKK